MCRCLRGKSSIFLFAMLSGATLQAQRVHPPVSLTLQAYYGSFVTSAPKATFIRDSYTRFTEVMVSRQTDGSKAWHRFNNFPQTGLSFVFGNPGSKQFLGRSYSLYPFVSFPIIKAGRFRTGLRIGTGISYIEKPYHLERNHKNTIIGSHLNNYIHGSLENEFRLYRRWYVQAGVAFAHISNGGVKLPNFGLNFVTITSGLRYAFSETGPSPAREKRRPEGAHWRVNTSLGIKQTPWAGSPRYAVGILSGEYLRPVSGGSAVGGGLVVFYDPSLTRDPSGYIKINNKGENVQLAAYGAYERNLGRLSIPVQVGVYFLNPSKRGSLYQNFGLRYALSPHIAAFYNLKIHAGKADYLHGGIGYTFK